MWIQNNVDEAGANNSASVCMYHTTGSFTRQITPINYTNNEEREREREAIIIIIINTLILVVMDMQG